MGGVALLVVGSSVHPAWICLVSKPQFDESDISHVLSLVEIFGLKLGTYSRPLQTSRIYFVTVDL